MPADQDYTHKERSILERMGQPLVLLVFLDLATLGLYSAARSYLLHAELSKKTGHRLFSIAFLHILIVLNLALCVMRFSRDNQPLDATLIMARLGAGLLFISLLLIFRRYLQEEFHLRIRPLPLAIFGYWYLQYRINRAHLHRNSVRFKESWLIPLFVIAAYVTLSLVISSIKHYRVPNVSMEPNLVVGDHVLVDQLSYTFFGKPQRAEILAFRPTQEKGKVQIKRVLGLPGDLISFHGDLILLNGKAVPCESETQGNPPVDNFDQTPKRIFECRLDNKTFVLHRYQQGALTAVKGDFEVPPDHYFLVGDNLDNSPDSRTMGAIPAENILGRARLITISYRLGEPIPFHHWFRLL